MESNAAFINQLFFIELNDSKLFQPGYPSFLLSKSQKQKKETVKKELNEVEKKISPSYYSFLFSRYIHPLLMLSLDIKIKIVCDVDDIYFEVQQSKIRNTKDYIKKLKLFFFYVSAKRKIKKILYRIDYPIVVKDSDRKFFSIQKAICLQNLPFGYFLNKAEGPNETEINSKSAQTTTFGFIGKLSYGPNFMGLIAFIKLIWNPLLKKGFQGKFIIAGSGKIDPSLEKCINASSNILFLGFIENAVDFWNKIDVLTVPVNEGGGTNIKIAEAFMYGKKVIASSFSSRGFQSFIKDGSLIVPEDNKDWMEEIQNQYSDSTKIKISIKENAQKVFDLHVWNRELLDYLNNTNSINNTNLL